MTSNLIEVKYGAETVTNHYGIDQDRLDMYAADHAEQMYRALVPGEEASGIITVSSGSVALGRHIWREHHDEDYPSNPQPLALLGSADLVVAWRRAYAKQGLLAGQVLVTQQALEDVQESSEFGKALNRSLELGIIPVVNENDALSVAELDKLERGGDNDRIARQIAQLMGVKALFLMTNVDGVEDEQGRIVPEVPAEPEAWQHVLSLIRPEKSKKGRGGMASKAREAHFAAARGIDTFIANASAKIEDIVARRAGTHFVAKASGSVE